MVISKIHWIRKQQSKFNKQERQTKREYISGESHYLFGKRYLLNVLCIENKPLIKIKRNKFIDLYINQNTDLERKEKLLEEFYRSEIKKQKPQLIEKWQNIISVNINEIKVKKMKTKWGSCNTKDKRIWLNLELAKKSLHCMEYVIVHEMIHILEKKHSDKFKAKMDSFMPNWKQFKNELNNSPLSYNNWDYQH